MLWICNHHVCVIGAFVPAVYIGLLGFIPLLIGLYKLYELLREKCCSSIEEEKEAEIQHGHGAAATATDASAAVHHSHDINQSDMHVDLAISAATTESDVRAAVIVSQTTGQIEMEERKHESGRDVGEMKTALPTSCDTDSPRCIYVHHEPDIEGGQCQDATAISEGRVEVWSSRHHAAASSVGASNSTDTATTTLAAITESVHDDITPSSYWQHLFTQCGQYCISWHTWKVSSVTVANGRCNGIAMSVSCVFAYVLYSSAFPLCTYVYCIVL